MNTGLQRTSGKAAAPVFTPVSRGLLQRQCACGNHTSGGECDGCAEKKRFMRRKVTNESSPVIEAPPIVREALSDGGRPLDAPTRAFFEPRFGRDFSRVPVRSALSTFHAAPSVGRPGDVYEQEAEQTADATMRIPETWRAEKPELRSMYDFSRVRVHADAKAAESARAVGALAYTVGHDVVFGENQYAPGTAKGQRLLAHELTHVMQQDRDAAGALQRKDGDEPETKKEPPKDAGTSGPTTGTASGPTAAPTSACGGASLAATVAPSDKRMNGTPIDAKLDPTDFGNTSKLGADFKFGACKVGATWRFQLDALVVPIASKVQPVAFRTNVGAAADAVVTKDSYADIVSDLSPTTKGTFSVSCGGKSFKDTVTTYSPRKTYWNQQFVIDHEAFHRKDWTDMYKTELVKAESDIWAHSIAASDATDAAGAVAKANADLTKFMTDAYGRLCDAFGPKKESRAYDAGAPAYQKLVNDINARATKEKWA